MNLGVAIENDKGKKYTPMQVPLRIPTLYLFTHAYHLKECCTTISNMKAKFMMNELFIKTKFR